MAQRKQFVPGSIYVRPGTQKLYIKYKGKRISTGLNDTQHGRTVAAEMLKRMHYDEINFNPNAQAVKSIKVRAAFDSFLSDHCKGLEETTITQYKLAFMAISQQDYYLNDARINTDVMRFTKEYATRVKQSTITNYLRHYSVFVNYCLKKRWITQLPENLRSERKISKKYEIKKKIVVFEKEEFDLLIRHFNSVDAEFSLLLQFLWFTGGRISETLKLQWSQIDMKQRRIRYANKINIGEDDYLPITSSIEEILIKLKAMNHEKLFRWTAASKTHLNRRLNKAMTILGIDKQERGFHAIRRTFATNLIENNVSLADVKDLMRHKDIKTTLEHYKAKKGQRLQSILEENIS